MVDALLPLTYQHRDSNGGHRNILWLLDIVGDYQGKDEMKRFWLARLFLARDSYLWLLPPLYISWKDSAWNREKASSYVRDKKTLTPLFYSHREYERDGSVRKSKFCFPLIPLFYRNSDIQNGATQSSLVRRWERIIRESRTPLVMPLWFRATERRDTCTSFPAFTVRYDESSSYHHLLRFFFRKRER
jgi:hypothetical protein